MSEIDWKAENAKKTAAVEEAHREIERLRAALREIAKVSRPYVERAVNEIAREALGDG